MSSKVHYIVRYGIFNEAEQVFLNEFCFKTFVSKEEAIKLLKMMNEDKRVSIISGSRFPNEYITVNVTFHKVTIKTTEDRLFVADNTATLRPVKV